MKMKLTTKLICLIACLTMLIGSTICVSAEETTYLYAKADGTYETRTGAIPAVDDHGLPVFYKVRENIACEVAGITPAGNYVYGNWDILYTPEQVALLYAAIDAAGITNEMPKYDKAVAINNYICSVFTYDMDGSIFWRIPWEDGLIALQMGGLGVCCIYADLYQTMCQAVGIECEVVAGTCPGFAPGRIYSDNGSHAWNAVYIDGREYFVDVTWNDTSNGNRYLMSETGWENHKFDHYEWQEWNKAAAIVYETRIRDKRNYGPEGDTRIQLASEETIEEVYALNEQFGPFNWGYTQFITVNGQTIRIV